jgi:hypothetical protein
VQSKDANVTEICRLADISAAAVNKSPKTTIKKTSSKKKKADE